MQPIGTHGGEVMYFGCVCFRGELGFLNCDDISSLDSSSLFLTPFMLTYSVMRVLSLLLMGLCPCVVSVVLFGLSVRSVVIPYEDVVVVVIVMRVLLFVLHWHWLGEV